MKRFAALCLTLVMLLSLMTGCGTKAGDKTASTKTTTAKSTETTPPTVPSATVVTIPEEGGPVDATLNGTKLSDYTLVYSSDASDYTIRAVTYIRQEVYKRTGAVLPVTDDFDTPTPGAHEIVVGEADRPISRALDKKTEGVQFSMLARDGHVAMEGDYFVIAAAAYYFIATYITGPKAATTVPAKARVLDPIVEKANNYIVLIGDGMGLQHTAMPQHLDAADIGAESDGERLFYGNLLPYSGFAHTDSLNGTTDSAASATALATGYKTKNGVVGRNEEGKDLLSLTELAGSLGMGTAVMSTEVQTGATPSGFSAHAADRDDAEDILASQKALQKKYGTVIDCDHNVDNSYGIYMLEESITNTLNAVQGEKGFFMMYEEAYIDKHSHSVDVEKAATAVYRFNQAIGRFMEFAFYHPDTFLLITADHETGGLTWMEGEGKYKFSSGGHTGRDVPVFAYGEGAQAFHGKTVENVQIPKTIAALWGQALAADTDATYPPLIKN